MMRAREPSEDLFQSLLYPSTASFIKSTNWFLICLSKYLSFLNQSFGSLSWNQKFKTLFIFFHLKKWKTFYFIKFKAIYVLSS